MSDDNTFYIGGAGAFTIAKASPVSVDFYSRAGKVLSIKCDGTIEPAEGFEPTEAGRQAILGMQEQLSLLIEEAARGLRRGERDD